MMAAATNADNHNKEKHDETRAQNDHKDDVLLEPAFGSIIGVSFVLIHVGRLVVISVFWVIELRVRIVVLGAD